MAFDPTHSGKLRSQFRAEAQARLRRLVVLTRTILDDHDVLGLRSARGVALSNEQRLAAFHDWFNGASHNVLRGSDWLSPHLTRAYQQGAGRAIRELRLDVVPIPHASRVAMHAATVDLKGIVDATVLRTSRTAASALSRGRLVTPGVLFRQLASDIDKLTYARLMMLCNTYIVKMHNLAKLEVYRAAGVNRVMSIPEKLPSHVHVGDARRRRGRGRELVNILTAGDDLVCQVCEDLSSDGPYSLDEATDLIPAHPRCRCAWVPADDARFASIEE